MNAVQCKMARAATGLGVRELAAISGVAQATISRLERGEDLRPATIAAIRAALESAGVAFIRSVGVRWKCEPVQWIDEWTLFDCYEGDGKPKSYYISRMEQRDGIALADLVSPKTQNREEAEGWARSGIWPGIHE